MAGRNSWNKLIDKLPAHRRAAIERGVREDMKEMLLSEWRRQAGLTQQKLAGTLGIKQPTLSALESQDDMQISTLRRIVEALGGELEIVASLPSGQGALSQFRESKRRSKTA